MSNINQRLLEKSASVSRVGLYSLNSAAHSPQAVEKNLRIRHQAITDTYPIEMEISAADFRVLCKIVNKVYDDCGRKRGAILRYIKHYKELEDEQRVSLPTKRLFNKLISK